MKLDTRTLWGARAGLGFVLMLGCSAGDGMDPNPGESDADPIEDALRTPRRGPRSPGHGPGRGNGHGHGHGKGGHHHHGPGCGHPPNEGGKGGSGGKGGGTPGMGTGAAAGSGGTFGSAGSASSSGGFSGTGSPGAGGSMSSGGSSGSGGFSGGGGYGVCGDGVPEGYEQCDDGNAVAGDGCDACMVEPGYVCDWGGSCHPVVCGDGLQESYIDSEGYWAYEECDDGNAAAGDGCSASCVIEPGHSCEWNGPCHEVVCGDGLQDGYALGDGTFDYERCDDGNVASGDGCSNACAIETGFVCPEPGVSCREVECGDGFQDYWVEQVDGGGAGGTGGSGGTGAGSGGTFAGTGGTAGKGGYIYHFEQCDDGNTESADGCSDTCEVEAGWICDMPAVPCRQPVCGDGHVDFIASGGSGGSGGTGMGGFGGVTGGSYEQCDDGNEASGDGCDSACTQEAGYNCPAPGYPCELAVCGNGWAEWPAEQCDDGNDVPNDGCTDCEYDGGWGGSGGTGMGGFGGASGGTGGTGMGGMTP